MAFADAVAYAPGEAAARASGVSEGSLRIEAVPVQTSSGSMTPRVTPADRVDQAAPGDHRDRPLKSVPPVAMSAADRITGAASPAVRGVDWMVAADAPGTPPIGGEGWTFFSGVFLGSGGAVLDLSLRGLRWFNRVSDVAVVSGVAVRATADGGDVARVEDGSLDEALVLGGARGALLPRGAPFRCGGERTRRAEAARRLSLSGAAAGRGRKRSPCGGAERKGTLWPAP
ncbi:MAG: hypothetical protein AAF192_05850 [Pseudomonadota bacterium]